jgi:hypothetical protein
VVLPHIRPVTGADLRIPKGDRWVPDPMVLRNPLPRWAVSLAVLDVCLPEAAA